MESVKAMEEGSDEWVMLGEQVLVGNGEWGGYGGRI